MNEWSFRRALLPALIGVACSGVGVVACGDDDPPFRAEEDAGPGIPEPDAQTEPLEPVDAGPEADAALGCVPGRKATATMGADGGTLSLCGATLDVPAGAVEIGETIGISIVEPMAAPWFEHAFSGPVFRFTPDNASLTATARIGLTRDTTKQRGPVLARWFPSENQWGEHEGCPKEDVLTLDTRDLGTFALMQDVNVYPAGPSGLGQATITLKLRGQETTWTVPGFGGYSVYEGSSDSRSIMLVGQRYEGEVLQNLDIRVTMNKNEPPALLQVAWISTDPEVTSWNFTEPVHGSPTSFTQTEPTPGTLAGQMRVVMHNGDETTPLEATYTTTPTKFRPPPSYSCNPPEGDVR